MGAALRTFHKRRRHRRRGSASMDDSDNEEHDQLHVETDEEEEEEVEELMELEDHEVGEPLENLCRLRRVRPLNLFGQGEPGPRSGHRMVASGSDLYVIGGYSPNNNAGNQLFKECWRFNLFARSWEQLFTKGKMPEELASHAALLDGHYLLVHGGTATPFGQRKSNQLHVLDLQSLQWRKIHCTATPLEHLPPPIYGHSLNLVPFSQEDFESAGTSPSTRLRARQRTPGLKYLYLIGGTGGWDYSIDIYRLDTATWRWEKVEPRVTCAEDEQATPGPRYRHETVFFNRRLWVLGGGTNDTAYGFHHLHAFNVDSGKWEEQESRSSEVDEAGETVFPAPRRCHSCVLHNDHVFLCGGYDGSAIFDDVWLLNFSSMCWHRLRFGWERPAYFHGAASTTCGQLFLFGGVEQIEQRRTRALYCCSFPKPGRLEDLAWTALRPALRELFTGGKLSFADARRSGVPQILLDRVPKVLPELTSYDPCGAA